VFGDTVPPFSLLESMTLLQPPLGVGARGGLGTRQGQTMMANTGSQCGQLRCPGSTNPDQGFFTSLPPQPSRAVAIYFVRFASAANTSYAFSSSGLRFATSWPTDSRLFIISACSFAGSLIISPCSDQI